MSEFTEFGKTTGQNFNYTHRHHNKRTSRTYIFNELVRRHSRYYEKVTDDDAHVFGPAFAQRAPQVLHFVGQLISKLQ